MIEFNECKTRRRSESIDEFTSILQDCDTNDTYTLIIKNLKGD